MNHSTKKPTPAEQTRLDAIHNMPCLACVKESEFAKKRNEVRLGQPSRTEAHHLVDKGRASCNRRTQMRARDFAESVTSLIIDQNGYQRLSTRNLILFDMAFESMRHHIKVELARRRGKVKLTVVQK